MVIEMGKELIERLEASQSSKELEYYRKMNKLSIWKTKFRIVEAGMMQACNLSALKVEGRRSEVQSYPGYIGTLRPISDTRDSVSK